MKQVIQELKNARKHELSQIGLTPRTNFKGGQEDHDKKHTDKANEYGKTISILEGDQEERNTNSLLSKSWFNLGQLPDNYSFRCLIKFKEFGIEGIDINHVSTGYWFHRDKLFFVDNEEMRDMTPKYFIPTNHNL